MERRDTASRVIDAPLGRVYAALVDPHALVEWLPPQGMTGHFVTSMLALVGRTE
jgi:uncharacterized protein YndB with AHSA1/START domain